MKKARILPSRCLEEEMETNNYKCKCNDFHNTKKLYQAQSKACMIPLRKLGRDE